MSIKISELFYSIQGEGRYMGVPSIFLRTFGCNFHCAGFGMTRGDLSTERDVVAEKHKQTPYTDYKSLPLVSTGCDSYASWDPRFKHLSPMLEIDAIVERIVELLPLGDWHDEHLVITGGEPLLGWQRQYPSLLGHPKMRKLKEITFETNGTQELDPGLKAYLIEWLQQDNDRQITFSVSAKLPCSGHDFGETIKPQVVAGYQEVGYTYLKFVVATEEDVHDAETAVLFFRAGIFPFKIPVYLMPVGGVESVYQLNAKTVALAAMARGWRYSDRLQVPLFKNEWGT
jgi:organic radical activating enzyme